MTAISLPSVQQLTHLFPYRYSSSNVDRWVVSPTGAGSDHPHHALASHLRAARRPCESEEARCRARALLLDGGPAPAAASRHHAGVREPFAGVLPLLHPLRDAGRADGSPADAGDRVCAAQRAGPRLRAAMVPGRRAARGSRVTEDRRSLRSASTLAVAGCRHRRSSLIGRAVPSGHRP